MSLPVNLQTELEQIVVPLSIVVGKAITEYDKADVVRNLFDRIVFQKDFDSGFANGLDQDLLKGLLEMRRRFQYFNEMGRHLKFKNLFVDQLKNYDPTQKDYEVTSQNQGLSVSATPIAKDEKVESVLKKRPLDSEQSSPKLELPVKDLTLECADLARKLTELQETEQKTSKVVKLNPLATETPAAIAVHQPQNDVDMEDPELALAIAESLKQSAQNQVDSSHNDDEKEMEKAVALSLKNDSELGLIDLHGIETDSPLQLVPIDVPAAAIPAPISDEIQLFAESQEDLDMQLARRLQEEEDLAMGEIDSESPASPPTDDPAAAGRSPNLKANNEDEIQLVKNNQEELDLQAARALQEEMEREAAEQARALVEKEEQIDFFLPFMQEVQEEIKVHAEPEITKIQSLRRREKADNPSALDSEVRQVPGYGFMAPEGRLITNESPATMKLYRLDWATVDTGTKNVRLECTTANTITVSKDCEIEILDLQKGTITIHASRVKLHNVTDTQITIIGESKVTVTGNSTGNIIKADRDDRVEMDADLAKQNVFV